LDGEAVVERESIPCEAVGERNEALHAEEIYVCLRDERRIRLIELIDAKQKEDSDGHGSAAC